MNKLSVPLLGVSLLFVHLVAAIFLLVINSSGPFWSGSFPWVPSMGLNLDFHIGSFQAWFMTLILVISGCIQLYATSYFKGKKDLTRLLWYLQFFTLAMLGVVASNNLFLTFLFWEITSLCSFLLVGLNHKDEQSRRKATQGLLITMFGGLGLLVGSIFLYQSYGTVNIQDLRAMPFIDSTVSYAAMLCIILACITKSAQFPFHFWLPNAMAGPTPVSALLHSATMVKAGVFLLAMLAPLFASSALWTPLLVSLGVITLWLSTLNGLKTFDFKQVLASTTLAALGCLTILAGIGSETALKAFAIFLTAHALYKAPLFLSAGVIESCYGTKDLREIRGACRKLPVVGAVLVISFLSLFGLPPLTGFLGKEYFLTAAWKESPVLAGIVVVTLATSIGMAVRAFWYLSTPSERVPAKKEISLAKHISIIIPATIAITISIGFSLFSSFFKDVASDLAGGPQDAYKLWAGFTPALFLSILVFALAYPLTKLLFAHKDRLRVNGDALYESFISGLLAIAQQIGFFLNTRKLHTQLCLMLTFISIFTLVEMSYVNWDIELSSISSDVQVFALIIPMLIVAGIFTAVSKRVVPTIIALGVIGILMAIVFLWFSAPDLALTQLLAEILILFFIVGVIVRKRQFMEEKFSYWRAITACLMGLSTTLLVLKAHSLEWSTTTSKYYLENSYVEGFGKNVVNVILVDFRAMDTLGELTVLAIAALGVTTIFGAARERAIFPPAIQSSWQKQLFNLLVIITVPLALFTLYRGHNSPGGGFIAGLLTAILVGFGLLVGAPGITSRKLRTLASKGIAVGLTIAVAPVFIPLFVGRDPMEGLWLHWGSFHLGTPLLFDVGVYILVVGFTVQYLRYFVHPAKLNYRK